MVLIETLMAEPNPHSISRTPVRTKLRSLTGRFSDCRGKTAFPNAYEVKALSPHHRFVIALHSPGGVAETGLRVCPPEKNARKLARDVRRATFSSAV